MRARKLACQGCGADIDPEPGQKYIDCEYCGTTNVLESNTVSIAPGSAKPQIPPGGFPQAGRPPQVHIQIPRGPTGGEVKQAGKIIGLVVLSVVIAFVGIGVTVFIRVFKGVSDAKKQHREAMEKVKDVNQVSDKKMKEVKRILQDRIKRAASRVPGAFRRKRPKKDLGFRLESDNPLLGDADDDGIMDALVRGSGGVVAAIDGTSGDVLWKKKISGRSRKLFLADKLVLYAHGTQLSALALKDGKLRWTAKLDDWVYALEQRGGGLALQTNDDELLWLDLATGKRKKGQPKPFKVVAVDDKQKWFGNLGPAFRLRGRARRASMYYCRRGQVLKGKSVTRRRGPFTTRTTTYGCRDQRALVYAKDSRRRYGFMIGLQKGRGKVWEKRLPGRAARFHGGSPKVDIQGGFAAVAYKSRRQAGVVYLTMGFGRAKWTYTFERGHGTIRGVTLAPKRVFVRLGSELLILDTATGKPPKVSGGSGSNLPAP